MAAACTLRAAAPIPYAPAPNDTYFEEQWYLENLNTNTARRGFDMNARSAWSFSRGEGVTIAIVDTGVDLAHPDLTNRAVSRLHWDFETETAAGHPKSDVHNHGTPVAGLAVAQGNNDRGVAGMAPEAGFASWIIYNTNQALGNFVDGDRMARMFQSHLNEVQVQNHSWVKPGIRRVRMTPAENGAISNAVLNGRNGRGVVMVRASGNDRAGGRNANDDEYTADPRVITVGGLRADGRVASYSTPGAPILVAGLGGDFSDRTLMTTDRLAQKGYNQINFTTDLADYVFSSLGFQGTSAAAPLVSGVVAMMLSENPSLTVRDVQHILVQAAFQTDFDDPDMQETPAGLRVSHNTGFGLVNAGTALDLASNWKPVSSSILLTNTVTRLVGIPDAGLQVGFRPAGGELVSISALPGVGVFADENTPLLPLVYVGQAIERITTNLAGKGALIQRGGTNYDVKLANAARAGAEFAVVFNNTGTNALELMGGTDFAPIPAVFISQATGDVLARLATNAGVQAQITLAATNIDFTVTEAVSCEQVRVHVDAAHALRGDMRVTLVSPMGTRSVLQRLGADVSPVEGRWTYMTTHHFYESSVGTWRLFFSDLVAGSTGEVRSATLEISGVPIKDTDTDGLDDDWENTRIGNLASGLADDPDSDGYSNAREQVQGTDPKANENILRVDLSAWDDSYLRINWPSRGGVTYDVLGTADLGQPFEIIASVPGGFPRTAWFGEVAARHRFFMVREAAP